MRAGGRAGWQGAGGGGQVRGFTSRSSACGEGSFSIHRRGVPPQAGKTPLEAADAGPIVLAAPEELSLALTISRFPEVIEETLDELLPNRLTDYLYELSTKFNDFYQECQVIGSAEEGSRLQLCEATAVIMRQTFELLGVKPLERL